MNTIAEIQRINQKEFENKIPYEASWHQKYKHSAWIYIGGLSYDLTEGDIICVMSQVGEVEDFNLIRDKETGKSKGFAFLKYENVLSTVLAVDNFNGSVLLDRKLRVDHVDRYRLPKELQESSSDSESSINDKNMIQKGLPGHAYEGKELKNKYSIHLGPSVFNKIKSDDKKKKKKKKKKEKHYKKEKKVKKNIEK